MRKNWMREDECCLLTSARAAKQKSDAGRRTALVATLDASDPEEPTWPSDGADGGFR